MPEKKNLYGNNRMMTPITLSFFFSPTQGYRYYCVDCVVFLFLLL